MMGGADLSPIRRQSLAALAEVIAPRMAAMPSAGDLGLSGDLVDQVLRKRPDLAVPLAVVIDATAAMPPQTAVPWLAANDPAAFRVLMQVVAGAYYMHPAVWRLLGYSGQQAIVPGGGTFGAEALATRMAASPPRFRDEAADERERRGSRLRTD